MSMAGDVAQRRRYRRKGTCRGRRCRPCGWGVDQPNTVPRPDPSLQANMAQCGPACNASPPSSQNPVARMLCNWWVTCGCSPQPADVALATQHGY